MPSGSMLAWRNDHTKSWFVHSFHARSISAPPVSLFQWNQHAMHEVVSSVSPWPHVAQQFFYHPAATDYTPDCQYTIIPSYRIHMCQMSIQLLTKQLVRPHLHHKLVIVIRFCTFKHKIEWMLTAHILCKTHIHSVYFSKAPVLHLTSEHGSMSVIKWIFPGIQTTLKLHILPHFEQTWVFYVTHVLLEDPHDGPVVGYNSELLHAQQLVDTSRSLARWPAPPAL